VDPISRPACPSRAFRTGEGFPQSWSRFSALQLGDALIVSELSRLGQSVGEMITMVDRLVTQQSHVFALQEGLRLTHGHDL
jgi:DNA invertase Pin-like site-specific DNA recombinase